MARVKCIKCHATIPDDYKACPKCGTPKISDNFCTNKKCEYHTTPLPVPTCMTCPKCCSETTIAREVEKFL